MQCDFSFENKTNILKHGVIHSEGIHICELCNLKFKSKKAIRIHISKSHELKMKSPAKNIKKYDFSRFVKLTPKVGIMNKEKLRNDLTPKAPPPSTERKHYACLVCESVLMMSREQLVRHSYDKHVWGGQIECDECSKKFQTKSDILFHITFLHEEHEIVSCTFCPYSGMTIPSGLKLHTATEHTAETKVSETETLETYFVKKPGVYGTNATNGTNYLGEVESVKHMYTVNDDDIEETVYQSKKPQIKHFKRVGGTEQTYAVHDVDRKCFKRVRKKKRVKRDFENGKSLNEMLKSEITTNKAGVVSKNEEFSYFNPLKSLIYKVTKFKGLRNHLNYLLGALGKPKIPKDDPNAQTANEEAIKDINKSIHQSLSIDSNFKSYSKGFKLSKYNERKNQRTKFLRSKKMLLNPILKRYNWYLDPSLPPGWKKRGHKRRKTTKQLTTRHVDYYYLSPCGRQVRSRTEMKSFINKNKMYDQEHGDDDMVITSESSPSISYSATDVSSSSSGYESSLELDCSSTDISYSIPTEVKTNNDKSVVVYEEDIVLSENVDFSSIM